MCTFSQKVEHARGCVCHELGTPKGHNGSIWKGGNNTAQVGGSGIERRANWDTKGDGCAKEHKERNQMKL